MCVVVNSNDSVLFVHIFVLVTIYLYDQISCFLCYYTNVGWDCGSPTSEWNNNNIVIEESKQGGNIWKSDHIHPPYKPSKQAQTSYPMCIWWLIEYWSCVNLRKSVVCNVLKWKLMHTSTGRVVTTTKTKKNAKVANLFSQSHMTSALKQWLVTYSLYEKITKANWNRERSTFQVTTTLRINWTLQH